MSDEEILSMLRVILERLAKIEARLENPKSFIKQPSEDKSTTHD
jgi:hypothetical protein